MVLLQNKLLVGPIAVLPTADFKFTPGFGFGNLFEDDCSSQFFETGFQCIPINATHVQPYGTLGA